MKYFIGAFTGFVGVIAIGLFLSFLLAWPVMELWNQCLVPAVGGVKEIGWLQAWGLQFLVNLLFKMSIVNKKD
jgi:hypothetical protein